MPKITSQQELDQLVDAVGSYPAGTGIGALLAALLPQLERRSLQRRLASLVARERLQVVGQARATRYFKAKPKHSPDSQLTSTQFEVAQPQQRYHSNGIRTSKAGAEIRAYVQQPRLMRTPVGYKFEFLEQYYPNKTEYLSQSLRDQLHSIGRSPREREPAGTFARDILNRLLIDLSWASSQLEKNTYSLLDTKHLIEFGLMAEGKDSAETQMILNHKNAIEFLVRSPENTQLGPDTVIALHALLSEGLTPDPSSEGRIRHCSVGIGGSVYLPCAVPQQISELFGIVVKTAAAIHDPFEQAFFLMVHLPYLQPFENVNKRVSRLAANIPLIRHNLCPLSFLDVAQQDYVDAILGVYELNRIELLRDVFVAAYARSCQQYVAVIPQLVPPNKFRMRYRKELGEVVVGIISRGAPAGSKLIRALVPTTVAVDERNHFVELVQKEFRSLHASNAICFGIRPLEFSSWLAKNS